MNELEAMAINFSRLKPEDVLEASFLPRYQDELDGFHRQLAGLNEDLFISEQIVKFPFHLLGRVGRQTFWGRTSLHYFEAVILGITKLTEDGNGNGPDAKTMYSIRQFKNDIRKAIVSEYKDAFDKHVKKIQLDKSAQTILDKVTAVRNDYVAHQLRYKERPAELEERQGMTLSELKKMRDSIKTLFDGLAIGAGYSEYAWDYMTQLYSINGRTITDIEELLIYEAKQSPCLNMPENGGLVRKSLLNRLEESDFETFNHWRQRCGLRTISRSELYQEETV